MVSFVFWYPVLSDIFLDECVVVAEILATSVLISLMAFEIFLSSSADIVLPSGTLSLFILLFFDFEGGPKISAATVCSKKTF